MTSRNNRNPPDSIMIFSLSLVIKAKNLTDDKDYRSPGFIAPEVITKQQSGAEADIFSCGAIMYMLLSGISPFSGLTLEEVIKKNKKGNIEYPDDIWKYPSPEALDLTKKMLEKDYTKRFTIDQCLDHNWFKEEGKYNNLKLALFNIKNNKE